MKTLLLVFLALSLFASTANAQIDPDRFTKFLDKQPYKIYFWFDSLGGNPYDLTCPKHFQPIRLVPQSPGISTDTAFVVQSNLQSKAQVLYYFVPSQQDQQSDLILPAQTMRTFSTEKPYAPSRNDALILQQYIDTTSTDVARYNQLLEKARRTKANSIDYMSVGLFFLTSVGLFANTDFNGEISGGTAAFGGIVMAGGVWAFINTLSKTSRYDNIMKEVRQLELSLNLKF